MIGSVCVCVSSDRVLSDRHCVCVCVCVCLVNEC
jgi:hypothetical protein